MREHLYSVKIKQLLPAAVLADDALYRSGLYQWFYHSHGPENGRGLAEHGHFHLFAARALWERIAKAPEEVEFSSLADGDPDAETRHLLAISTDAKGVPGGLFTTAPRVRGRRDAGRAGDLGSVAPNSARHGISGDRPAFGVVDSALPAGDLGAARQAGRSVASGAGAWL